MTVLVCGGRDYDDKDRVWSFLDELRPRVTRVVVGGATGADTLAAQWARARGVPADIYRAEWATHGRAAGPLRNQRMLDEGRPKIVIAFPGGQGTSDMIHRANAAGVPCYVVSRERS